MGARELLGPSLEELEEELWNLEELEEVGEGGRPGSRKLKLPASHPRLDRNCLPIFSKFFALYYIPFIKLTSFKKQF